MFLDNKYTKWYFSLVDKAKERNWDKKTALDYVEKHHIIPKSFGGDNSKDNLVCFTAREHFIAHILLVKMTGGKNKRGMACAISKMMYQANEYQKRYKNSKMFDIGRKELALAMTGENNPSKRADVRLKLGFVKTQEHRDKISASKMGKKTKGWSEESKLARMGINANCASKFTFINEAGIERTFITYKEFGDETKLTKAQMDYIIKKSRSNKWHLGWFHTRTEKINGNNIQHN